MKEKKETSWEELYELLKNEDFSRDTGDFGVAAMIGGFLEKDFEEQGSSTNDLSEDLLEGLLAARIF